jgi:putative ABC transport system permease protein
VNEFFGIDMTYIMIALLGVLFVALGSIGYVVARNRVMFQVGVRNIPRRRAQTTLIIIGLMLSTLIISTALSIGDTVDYSVTSTTYSQLGSIDELAAARTEDAAAGGGEEEDAAAAHEEAENNPGAAFGSIVSPLPIPGAEGAVLVEEFRRVDGVDGAIGVVRGPVPVSNPAKGQTEPLTLAIGLPDDMAGFESDLETLDGRRAPVSELGQDELYANETAAKKLDIEAGDRLTLFAQGQPSTFTVRAIVKDRVLTGSLLGDTFGFAMRIDRARELFGRGDEFDFIAVSNDGGVREGVRNSEAVTDSLNKILDGTRWDAATTKKDMVDTASLLANILTTFFVVLGLFSIAAGMLLIFLIFVMLAAERKMEMGMVRAVGTKRSHLVQMFMSEGMVYNMAAAAIGAALGVLVSIVMVGIMARLFADFGLRITFHVTARSLIVAYSIGVVLTFLTVTFSSWRIGNLNIVSAIRDVADPVTAKARPAGGHGGAHALRMIAWVLFKPETWGQFFRGIVLAPAGAVLAAAGVGLFMGADAVYGAGAAGGVLGVLLGVLGGFAIAAGAGLILLGLSQILQPGPLMLLAAPILMAWGWQAAMAFQFGLGFSLLIIGGALLIRFLGAPARPVFTAMGLVMLFFWLLFAGNNVPGIKEMNGDIEMFFLSGVTMVLAGTFVLVYNADLLLQGLTLVGGVMSTLVPSIKTAVAYPLANKFRTGMTIAMISLVMFALVMFSTMNENFDRLFNSDDALAGYEVLVTENPGNPLDDLVAALKDNNFPTGGIAGVDRLTVANRQVSKFTQLNLPQDEQDARRYAIYGMSPEFIANSGLTFQQRATGFDTDQAVMEALAANPDYAIVDVFAIQQSFGPTPPLKGFDPADRTFDPVPLQIVDTASGASRQVQLIGIISTPASGLFTGLFVPQATFDEVYARPETTLDYVRLNPGASANDTAKGIERTLLAQGAQADSLRQVVDDYQAQSRGFLYLMQGFMGIGLFVGIAAVGVVAFRTVVERRQQIGMLRAIGYTRRAIALSFLMESSFTALLGIFSGIALALLLARQLVQTDEFVSGGVTSFYIPWLQILAIGGFAFVASLIMTIIPSRQASSIPIAEALRYE